MYEESLVAGGIAAAMLAGGLGLHFLVASRRLGGLAVLPLPGVGFLALAAAAPLLAPALLDKTYGVFDVLHLILQLAAFSAIALGYLLRVRHGDAPEPGYSLAYQAFFLAGVAALAPFAAFSALHPVLRELDEAGYFFDATLAFVVAARLALATGPAPRRRLVALGFAVLAMNQVVLGFAHIEPLGTEVPLAVIGEATLLLGLACFAATVALERREGRIS